MSIWLIVLAVILGIIIASFVLALVAPRIAAYGPIRLWLALRYRPEVIGLENLPATGGYLIISNHVSWIDGLLLQWLLPKNVRFVVHDENFTNRMLRKMADAFGTIMMHNNPKSIARAIRAARSGIESGDVVGVFPEGTLTRTGQLQSFHRGFKAMVKGTNAPVVPVWVEGMWGSMFSFSGGKFFYKLPAPGRRRIRVYIGEPIAGDKPLDKMRSAVSALGARANIDNRAALPVLASHAIRAWRRRGRKIIAADSLGTEAGGRQLLIRTLALRRVLRREVLSDDEQHVGILLPPSVAGVAVNVALAFDRRITANLNYSANSEVINHCIKEVGIKHVLTSQAFMDKMELEIDSEVIIMEELRDKVSTVDKIVALIQAVLMPAPMLDRVLGLNKVGADDLITVIFTSGSTGMPKGVQLSNANVAHNVDAIDRAVKLTQDDTVLGILPFFHSFGYSVTLWAALTLGPRGAFHFNPLDARQVGKLAKKYKATVLLGTPTFLRGYLRRISADEFASLDVVVVGAEKMPADLFEAFEKKFGVRPVEGYGATELSPLVSVNIPPSRSAAVWQKDRNEGSVGRPVPGVSARIVDPDSGDELGVDQDGMLLITGPNVMRGYANRNDLTEKAVKDGWYETGDIANIDSDGFIHITGRLSRFSKIGGEMVPHVRIEDELSKLFSEGDEDELVRQCVTSVPDPKKGERLVVLHLPTEKEIGEIRKGLSNAGLPNIFIPSQDSFLEVDEIPMLGTGKLDLRQTRDVASEKLGVPLG